MSECSNCGSVDCKLTANLANANLKQDNARFHCDYEKCGSKCCRFIRYGSPSAYNLDVKRGIHFLVQPSNAGISVMNWERELLLSKAKELSVSLDIKPLSVALTNEGVIVVNWFLNHDACPLIGKDGACLIYQDRPLTCRLFPLMHPLSMSSECPYVLSPELLKGKSFNELLEAFGDSFLYYNLKELISKEYTNAVNELIIKGVVKKVTTRRVINEFNFNGWLGFIEELLERNKLIDKDYVNQLVKLIKNPVLLKELIANVSKCGNSLMISTKSRSLIIRNN